MITTGKAVTKQSRSPACTGTLLIWSGYLYSHFSISGRFRSDRGRGIRYMSAAEGQQHPISVYLWIWGLLFVLSGFSYMVDYLQLQGYLRWSLILLFMFLKAGLIISIFMHMAWERMALITAIILPPVALLFLIALMAIEGDYILLIRETIFSVIDFVPVSPHH